MARFTDKDALEFNMPLPLLKKWDKVMNALWHFLRAYKKVAKDVTVEAVDYTIKYQRGQGKKFTIGVNFTNKKYLSLFVKIDGDNIFEAIIDKIEAFKNEGIVKIVANILQYAEDIKN
ncbi:hypothetical protein ACFOWM_06165 [Ferruginibacter yonginensis]|uniref:DUF721 domain-containing protein n=1 Tax=Ferruginibacter yonginensis TaxID=1310416 RepID=A0ABV8QRK6_9BACT